MYTLTKNDCMKKIFTLFSIATCFAINAFAGTPTIDGMYSPSEGWGTAVATGNGIVGWADANARSLYITTDANYVYFGAECSAQSWQQFIFAVNTKAGGDGTDPWGRTITYNHANKPDFLFRGDIAGSNYAQFQVWDGIAWTGTATNINAAGTEVKGIFAGTAPYNGFIEIRVPRSVIGAMVNVADVQFIITGNNGGAANGHGCFDAIPNDNNCTDWNAPNNVSLVSQYASNITLPANINNFSGAQKGAQVSLNWSTTSEINVANFEVEKLLNNTWSKLGTVTAKNNSNGAAYNFVDAAISSTNQYRLKIVNRDGSYSYSNIITIKTAGKNVISVYPTIVENGTVTISLPAVKTGKVSIQILSNEGKVVLSNQVTVANGNVVLQQAIPSSLTKGSYVVKVQEDGATTTARIIVQ